MVNLYFKFEFWIDFLKKDHFLRKFFNQDLKTKTTCFKPLVQIVAQWPFGGLWTEKAIAYRKHYMEAAQYSKDLNGFLTNGFIILISGKNFHVG